MYMYTDLLTSTSIFKTNTNCTYHVCRSANAVLCNVRSLHIGLGSSGTPWILNKEH